MNMLNLNDMPLIMIIENAPPKIISKLRLMQMMLNIKENTFFAKMVLTKSRGFCWTKNKHKSSDYVTKVDGTDWCA